MAHSVNRRRAALLPLFASVSRTNAAPAAVIPSISRRDQNLISGCADGDVRTFRGGATTPTTMKIAFVMEMADDGVTDVPLARLTDGCTEQEEAAHNV